MRLGSPAVAPFIVVSIAIAVVSAMTARRDVRAVNRPSVLIVTLDTTRADRLPVYGYVGAPMPAMERLAREGVVFDRAISVAPLTLPAHCSLFTGLLPPRHGVRDNADPSLADQRTTLAEILQAKGYRTGAFIGSVVLDSDRGLAQGFDHYSGVPRHQASALGPVSRRRAADAVVDDALRWIGETGDAPFFAWIHLYDAHAPYASKHALRSTYADPYVAEIAFADAQLGRVTSALEQRGMLDRMIVVAAGDHGEGLGEHGERDHGTLLYDSVLRVPLIIRAPMLSPRRVSDIIRIVDVMPTIVGLLGFAVPQVDGVDLAATLRSGMRLPELDAYSETEYPVRLGRGALRALRAGRYKLITGQSPQLFDIERDPFEQHNIYRERPETAAALERQLALVAHPDGTTTLRAKTAVAPELRDRLASLGYVSSGAPKR